MDTGITAEIPNTFATVNVTYNGMSGNMPDPVHYGTPDNDILGFVSECLRNGNIVGVDPVANPDLADFKIDRFNSRDGLPNRIVVRPKTEFGQ